MDAFEITAVHKRRCAYQQLRTMQDTVHDQNGNATDEKVECALKRSILDGMPLRGHFGQTPSMNLKRIFQIRDIQFGPTFVHMARRIKNKLRCRSQTEHRLSSESESSSNTLYFSKSGESNFPFFVNAQSNAVTCPNYAYDIISKCYCFNQ